MSQTGTILVGTVGQGVHRSADDGATWTRASVAHGLHSDAIVRCLTARPDAPSTLFAGSDLGLYRTNDAGASWQHIDSPMDGSAVWAVAVDDANPNLMLAGTGTPSPARFFRSTDGGASWEPAQAELSKTCPAVGMPRPTAMVIDPTDHSSVWAGVEVDGVRRSRDGGRTWERAAPAIRNPDVHNILITPGPPKRIFILVNDDLWISDDDGEEWRAIGIKQAFPWHYPRGITMSKEDPRVIYVTIGDTTPGRTGAVMRSGDAGDSWESLPLPGQPNSAMWTVTAPGDLVLAASRYGNLYRSDDAGDSWTRHWREFSEVSSLAWVPA